MATVKLGSFYFFMLITSKAKQDSMKSHRIMIMIMIMGKCNARYPTIALQLSYS